jgi:hypothetical protein
MTAVADPVERRNPLSLRRFALAERGAAGCGRAPGGASRSCWSTRRTLRYRIVTCRCRELQVNAHGRRRGLPD